MPARVLRRNADNRMAKSRLVEILVVLTPLSTVFVVQSSVLGWKSALATSPFAAAGLGLAWVVYSAGERRADRDRPQDAALSIPAARLVAASNATPSAHAIYKGWRRWVTHGELGGYLDVLALGIRWRPGPLASRWSERDINIDKASVESVSIRPRIPGLGRLAVDLAITRKDGTVLRFSTRNIRRLTQAIESLGLPWN